MLERLWEFTRPISASDCCCGVCCSGSIMNHHELLTLIQSCQAILTFLVSHGLLAARRRCSCGNQMVLRDDKCDDGYHRECQVNQCRKRRSIRAGSFFEYSKIPLSYWLYIIFLWSIDESNKKVSLLTGLSLRRVITALQRLRDICSLKILHGNLKLGGRGKRSRSTSPCLVTGLVQKFVEPGTTRCSE